LKNDFYGVGISVDNENYFAIRFSLQNTLQ